MDRKKFFEEHIIVHESKIKAYLVQFSLDFDMLEEVLQNTFISAWKNLHTLQDPAHAKAWLFTIAKNAKNEYWKKHALRARHFTPLCCDEADEMLEGILETDDSASDVMVKEFEHSLFLAAYNTLDMHSRMLLSMRYVSELSTSQIAQFLGLKHSTVKSRLHRTQIRLRNILAEFEKEANDGED